MTDDRNNIREKSQLTEGSDGYEGSVRRCGKVGQLSGSVTAKSNYYCLFALSNCALWFQSQDLIRCVSRLVLAQF